MREDVLIGKNLTEILAEHNYFPCSPKRNITEDTNSVQFLVYSSAVVITSSLGILGNILSGIVLCMPTMWSSYSMVLTSLTVSDTLQLLEYWLFVGSAALNKLGLEINIQNNYPQLAITLAVIGWIAFTASTYFTVLVSFERYIAICKPFQSLRLFPSRKRTLCYISGVVLFSIMFNLPKWWELKPCVEIVNAEEILKKCEKKQCDLNSFLVLERRRIERTSLGQNELYDFVYVNCANILINFILPLVTLVVLNISIYRGMIEATSRQRMMIPAGQVPDNSITSMLIVVVVVFCSCHIWYTVSRVIKIWWKVYEKSFSHVYTFLYCFNASVNFLIYCVWGKKFRKQFMFLCQQANYCERPATLKTGRHTQSNQTLRSTATATTGV